MTDQQRFAYFKRTAPVEDLRFMIRIGTSDLPITLADAWIAAANSAPSRTAADNKRIFKSLCQRWRAASNERERASGDPAIGSPAWREALIEADARAAELAAELSTEVAS